MQGDEESELEYLARIKKNKEDKETRLAVKVKECWQGNGKFIKIVKGTNQKYVQTCGYTYGALCSFFCSHQRLAESVVIEENGKLIFEMPLVCAYKKPKDYKPQQNTQDNELR